MTLANRLHKLEQRQPRPSAAPYIVFTRPGESEGEAVARVKPGRSYIVAPEPMTMQAWTAAVAA